MAMAGWKTGDMLDGIEGIMNLAAASGEDLATTSDIVTDALTAFGLTAADSGHFADVLAAASSNANTNVSMMGETFKYCAPVAGSLGFSCEDTAQAIGLMANSGIKSTQAGTALRTIMNTLAGDVKICGDAIGTVEIATTNADGSMRELNDILADCRTAFSQLSESEQANAAKALVGKNAMSGFLALMNAAPADIEKLEGAISTCSDTVDGYNGVTEKMAAVMQDNLSGQITILKSQLQELAISFGEILMPAIRAIVSRIQGLIDKFNAMSPATKETIVKVALVAAALGPLLVVVGKTMVGVGKLMQLISNLPTIITGAKAAFTSFGAAIGGISAPVVAVIAVVAALVAAFVHLWRTNEDFRNKITAIWNQIKSIFDNFCQGIVDRVNALGFNFQNISEVIKTVWDGLCKFLAPVFEGVFQQVANNFKAVTDIILNILDIFVGIFTGDWSRVWDGIKGIFVAVWNFLKDTLKNALNMICGIFGTDLGEVKEFWVNVWTNIKNFFVNIWNGIKNFVSTVLNAIKNFFTTIWTGIKNFFVNIWNGTKNFVSTVLNAIVNGIKNCIGKVADAVKGVANKIKSFLHFSVPDEGPLADFESWMPDFMQGLADGINANANVVGDAVNNFAGGLAGKISSVIQSDLSNVVTSVQGFMTQVFDTVKTVWTNANAAINATMSQISSGITSGWKAIVSTIKTALENIRNVITTTWKAVSSVISTALDGIKKIVTAVWTALKNLIKTGQLDIKSVVTTTWEAVSGVVRTAVNAIKSVVQSVWDAMPDTVRSAMNRVKEAVLSIWDNIRDGIGDRLGGVRDAVNNVMGAVYDAVMDKVNNSWSWGRDLIQNLVNGIRYLYADVVNAVADVANAIWEYLHFSVPEKGPLTTVNEWMPDFMKGLAQGINKSKKYVEKAVSSVADAMSLTMQSGFDMKFDGISGAMLDGGSGGVVNNYYNNDNSRTVNQTNNSPKSLSRLEIYRQTRNALNV